MNFNYELLTLASTCIIGLYCIIDRKKSARDSLNFQVKYFGMDRKVADSYITGSEKIAIFVGSLFIFSGLSILSGNTEVRKGTQTIGIADQLFYLFEILIISYCLYRIIKVLRFKE